MGRRTAPSPAVVGQLPVPDTQVGVEGLPGGPCTTTVGIHLEDLLQLEVPRVAGKPIPAPSGRELRLHYRRTLVPCLAVGVVEAPPKGGDGVWVRISSVERMQRREAVRVPVSINVPCIAVAPGGGDPQHLTLASEDLSAGGIRLRHDEWMGLGTLLAMTLDVADEPLRVKGIVIHVSEGEPSTRPWQLGVQFQQLSQGEADALVHYTFARERELRRRAAGLS